jgi:hypothetical protein
LDPTLPSSPKLATVETLEEASPSSLVSQSILKTYHTP